MPRRAARRRRPQAAPHRPGGARPRLLRVPRRPRARDRKARHRGPPRGRPPRDPAELRARAGGIDAFRTFWLAGKGDEIWAELGDVLALGGRFENDSTFVAPSTFTDSPDGMDPFEALIALGDAVPVRAAPESDADTLAILTFQVVRHEWRPSVARPPAGWVAVRLPDDSLGFVGSDSVWSPVDYRAIFVRLGGRWWMTIFIAGD